MTPEEAKQIEILIGLQKSKDKEESLTLEQAIKYAELLKAYQKYQSLNADQMAAKLAQELTQTETASVVITEGKDNNSIIEAYNAFKDEPWYKKPEPDSNGSTSFAFPSYAEAAQFFQKQAENKQEFVLIDATTNKVLAFSDGTGKMFHPNGKEFDKDDSFTAGLSIEEFTKLRQESLGNQSPSPKPS